MTYCERINDPQYRINLEQLTKILGDSNAAAAALESNNGFSLDKAPNGKNSFLYQSLYDIISEKYPDLSEEEKIEKAIKLKLQTYSSKFKEWFGDWKNDSTNASKVVDENGEPLVMVHNTKISGITKFKPGVGNAIYFADRIAQNYVSGFERGEYNYEVFLNIRDPYTESYESSFIDEEDNIDGVFVTSKVEEGIGHAAIIKNLNQIKSVENNGQYSLTDNNIYHEHFSDRVFNRTSTRDSKLTDYFTGKNSTARSLEIPLKEFIEKLQDNPQYKIGRAHV